MRKKYNLKIDILLDAKNKNNVKGYFSDFINTFILFQIVKKISKTVIGTAGATLVDERLLIK